MNRRGKRKIKTLQEMARNRWKWGGRGGIVEVAENLKLETRITLCAEEILKMKKRRHVGLRKMEAHINGRTMVTIYITAKC